MLELSLVAIESLMYWRTARQVSVAAGRSVTQAATCAGLIATFGVLVLYLDYSS